MRTLEEELARLSARKTEQTGVHHGQVLVVGLDRCLCWFDCLPLMALY